MLTNAIQSIKAAFEEEALYMLNNGTLLNPVHVINFCHDWQDDKRYCMRYCAMTDNALGGSATVMLAGVRYYVDFGINKENRTCHVTVDVTPNRY